MPSIVVDRISIGSNRRPIKDEKVSELMESIRANGLLHPITVDQNLKLIAGLHRLTACKLLGLDQIECNIITCDNSNRARLAEIDENLIRSELNALERAELWLERDSILAEMGLRAKPGDNQYTLRGSEQSTLRGSEMISPPPKTTLELAKEIGYTDRTFQQGKQIARSIAPEVKEMLRKTELASSPTALLKVARAGSEERKQAEQAEQAAQEAQDKKQKAESERYTKLATEARAKQKELQLVALHSATAEKEAKLAARELQRNLHPQAEKSAASVARTVPDISPGDEWILNRHFVYCGDTSGDLFIQCLPSNAALAIATLSPDWNHDYLLDEAAVVVVLRSAGSIHEFCRQHQMPFRFEWLLGDIYVAVFSNRELAKPQTAIEVRGVEGIVAYLIGAYTRPGNFVIAPFMGQGEVLMACEKMERICFVGESNIALVEQGIARWQNWTGQQISKA